MATLKTAVMSPVSRLYNEEAIENRGLDEL